MLTSNQVALDLKIFIYLFYISYPICQVGGRIEDINC